MSRRSAGKLLACAAVVSLGLAACSGSAGEESPGDDVSPEATDISGDVTYWHYTMGETGEEAYWEPVIERFNEQYPDVNMDVIIQPFQGREQALTVALAGGQAPDVVYFNPDFIPRFVEEGVLEPVSDVIEDDRDDWRGSALEAMTYDGETYGVPLLMNAEINLCMTEVLDAAGVECPETWDDIREVAPIIKDAGYYTTQYEGAIEVTLNGTFYKYLRQAGGEVLNEDMTEAAFNGPEGLETIEFLSWMAENEYFPSESLTALVSFEQTPGGTGDLAYLQSGTPASIAPFVDRANMTAGASISGTRTAAGGTVGGLSIFNTSDNVDAAKAWIDFITSEDEMRPFLEATSYHSPRESITGLFEDGSLEAAQEENLDDVWVGVMHPDAREMMDLIAPHVQAAILGREDPQTALDAAAAEVDDMLSRRG